MSPPTVGDCLTGAARDDGGELWVGGGVKLLVTKLLCPLAEAEGGAL